MGAARDGLYRPLGDGVRLALVTAILTFPDLILLGIKALYGTSRARPSNLVKVRPCGSL